MADIEKTKYDILWYLNEYPNEINATDEVIRSSLKLGFSDYLKAKEELLIFGQIEKRGDNKNNEAWRLTDAGRAWFIKFKKDFKIASPLVAEKDDELKNIQVVYYKSQIKNNKTADIKMVMGLFIGAILSVGGGLLLEMTKKTPKDKQEIIQVHVSTHNAAIDTVFVITDTIEKK